MNYRECYSKGTALLKEAGVPEPEIDARLLLEHVCGTDRNTLLVHGEMPVEEDKQNAYQALLGKRRERIPLQILLGSQWFCGLEFLVNEHVLIPRQDTEILVEAALKRLKSGMRLLDMCTGSGCILISLLTMTEGVTGCGVDISEEALKVAKGNGARLLTEEKLPQWYQGDLFGALCKDTVEQKSVGQPMLGVMTVDAVAKRDVGLTVPGVIPDNQYDMIVSNPPYIPSSVIETLQPEVRDFEPRNALDGSEDGLLFYRRIVKECIPFLKENGHLMFEIGHDQGEAVKSLMDAAGFVETMIIKDYAGLDRVVAGRLWDK